MSKIFSDPELSLGLQYQKRGPKRKMFSNEPCRVCGEPATGFNYRVVSCNACKGTGFKGTKFMNNLIRSWFMYQGIIVVKRLVYWDRVKHLMESIEMNEHHDFVYNL